MRYPFLFIVAVGGLLTACQGPSSKPGSGDSTATGGKPVRLITLDPGHFHAALLQKSMYDDIDSVVHVYAPEGPDVLSHLDKIKAYNTREKAPTHWEEKVYTGADFLQKMISEKAGNTVVLAGNNREKTNYILQSLRAGFHVLGDKPMVISDQTFGQLKQAFDTAAAHKRILYDIMTERYEITSILQRELAAMPAVFGTLEKGSPADPAFVGESVHRWYKFVSGSALTRPAWFFDVAQQGEGIADVMTHLVDLAQWECYPDQPLDYTKDIQVDKARHWTTDLNLSQFRTITKLDSFPDYLKEAITHDTVLKVYANGEISYRLKGAYIRTAATWTCKAPAGADDTYSSLIRGSKARILIRQDAEQSWHPALYIQPEHPDATYEQTLTAAFTTLQAKYPGIRLKKEGQRWEVIIPDSYKDGHEAHFAKVTEKFLDYVQHDDMPSWEVPNMIAKYYTTTRGLQLARERTAPPGKDTLKAQVATSLKGSTRDLSLLDVHTLTLTADQTIPAGSDVLVIVRSGSLKVTTGGSSRLLGPGGVALLSANDTLNLKNTGSAAAMVYVFRFQSWAGKDTSRHSPPFLLDWTEMTMKKTNKGEGRQIVNLPETWLGKIDMHATTLNPGEVSHPPHIHRNEEIILLRSGNVQMYIAGKYHKATAGDLVFLTSGTPHALENKSGERCEYFALQWQQ